MMTHYVISYSGGKASFTAAARAVEYAGAENVTLVFADTMIEDDDLYRFIREGADVLGAELVWLQDGRTPWEVFEDVKYIGNSRVAPCSRVLKTDQVRQWIKDNCNPENTVLCLGISSEEYERLERAQANWPGWTLDAPLCWRPWYSQVDVDNCLWRYGLRQPRLYSLGYVHNNCGGFCVRGGKGQFSQLLQHFPDRYWFHEKEMERVMEAVPNTRPFLRDFRGGEVDYITLRDFREEIEANPQQIDLLSTAGGCGCFVDDEG